MIPTLPLASRNRLAALILHALADSGARARLAELAAEEVGPDWSDVDTALRPRLTGRARTAAAALSALPIGPDADVGRALEQAGALFDAGLYFEVHELLEPSWAAASGEQREALQGLIQIAVGYQHLANGNLAGARALLPEGVARLRAGKIAGADTEPFARGVLATVSRLPAIDAASIPVFPRPGRRDIRAIRDIEGR